MYHILRVFLSLSVAIFAARAAAIATSSETNKPTWSSVPALRNVAPRALTVLGSSAVPRLPTRKTDARFALVNKYIVHDGAVSVERFLPGAQLVKLTVVARIHCMHSEKIIRNFQSAGVASERCKRKSADQLNWRGVSRFSH
ncbi:hypothetical protein FB451DRAFT_1176691 [Mycena latifolia]|nr:hypothetical protein FB451DRAFT_1176691 [Mycena latifolia]